MNVEIYGITDSDSLLKSVRFAKLISGENIVTYATHGQDGIISFLPYEIREDGSDYVLVPFVPFVKEKLFFFAFSNVQFIKNFVHSQIETKYRTLTETSFKEDIEDLMHSCQRIQHAELESDLSQGNITIH